MDVLSDIEIELLQGSAAQDDLGKGLNMIRQRNNKLRAEYLKGNHASDLNNVVINQFQLNDMLLTLFQETVAKFQELQLEVRKSLHFVESHEISVQTNDIKVVTSSASAGKVTFYLPQTDQNVQQLGQALISQPAEITRAMGQDALLLQIEVRPVKIPIIGGLLTRLRSAIHSLSLFYTNRLAGKQTDINRVYGEQLLELQQIIQSQQAEIVGLRQQISTLNRQQEQ